MRYLLSVMFIILALLLVNNLVLGENKDIDTSGMKGNEIKDLALSTDTESISKGTDLFNKLCKKCHDAYSTAAGAGPGLRGILKNELLPVSKKKATAENILNQLNRPVGSMPAFHWISEEDKLNIIAFLNTL